jgi:hypothetical protein
MCISHQAYLGINAQKGWQGSPNVPSYKFFRENHTVFPILLVKTQPILCWSICCKDLDLQLQDSKLHNSIEYIRHASWTHSSIDRTTGREMLTCYRRHHGGDWYYQIHSAIVAIILAFQSCGCSHFAGARELARAPESVLAFVETWKLAQLPPHPATTLNLLWSLLRPCPLCQPPLPASLAPVPRPSWLHSYFPPHPNLIPFDDVDLVLVLPCSSSDCHSQNHQMLAAVLLLLSSSIFCYTSSTIHPPISRESSSTLHTSKHSKPLVVGLRSRQKTHGLSSKG